MYDHIIEAAYGQPWAIAPSKLAIIEAFLARRLGGERLNADEVQAAMQAALPRGPRPQSGGVAVIPIYGTITQRAGLMTALSGGTSIDVLTQQFRGALADPNVRAIVFDIASPGGTVYGVQELAAEIYAARGRKPIAAVATSMAASAAYWIGCSASEFYVTPGGEVGSIGVWQAHQDYSKALEEAGVKTTMISAGKFKVEGNPYSPLDAEALSFMQSRVDDYYAAFTKAVARGRGVPIAQVREGMGQGRVLGADAALAQNMVDGIATLDDVIKKMRRDARQPSKAGATRLRLARDALALL